MKILDENQKKNSNEKRDKFSTPISGETEEELVSRTLSAMKNLRERGKVIKNVKSELIKSDQSDKWAERKIYVSRIEYSEPGRHEDKKGEDDDNDEIVKTVTVVRGHDKLPL
jgi:hypothetical protein